MDVIIAFLAALGLFAALAALIAFGTAFFFPTKLTEVEHEIVDNDNIDRSNN